MAKNSGELPRIARKRLVLSFICITLVVAAAAFVAGAYVRDSASRTIDEAMTLKPINVVATVQLRDVSDHLELSGVVSPAPTESVFVTATTSGSDPVVTSTAPADSTRPLSSVGYWGTVADRPIFLVPTPIPLYRDLSRGDEGTDVASLQAAIGAHVTGEMDWQTLSIIDDLYESADAIPPEGPAVSRLEWVSVPVAAKVKSVATVGTHLDADSPLAVLEIGSPHIEVRVNVLDVQRLTVGTEVAVRLSGGSDLDASVTRLGEFEPAGEGGNDTAGHDAEITLATTTDSGTPKAGESAIVIVGDVEAAQLAVPVTAIRSDAHGDYVLAIREKGAVRVDVVCQREHDGWVGIASDELSEGDHLQIS